MVDWLNKTLKLDTVRVLYSEEPSKDEEWLGIEGVKGIHAFIYFFLVATEDIFWARFWAWIFIQAQDNLCNSGDICFRDHKQLAGFAKWKGARGGPSGLF